MGTGQIVAGGRACGQASAGIGLPRVFVVVAGQGLLETLQALRRAQQLLGEVGEAVDLVGARVLL